MAKEERKKLIAAAPELLDALKSMLKSFSLNEDEDCMECGEKSGTSAMCDNCRVIDKAQAAISKATGKEATDGR